MLSNGRIYKLCIVFINDKEFKITVLYVADGIFGNITGEVYSNGNLAIHKLAELNDFDTIQKYLEILETRSPNYRQQALTATNRRGETAYSLATEDELKELLAWSQQQEGFYYLSTPPVVLLMYSTTNREGFDKEVQDFVNGLRNGSLNVAPIIRADLTAEGILSEVSNIAETHPNMSAFIVVYLSHGSCGLVETANHPLRIDNLLQTLCHPILDYKPKVS